MRCAKDITNSLVDFEEDELKPLLQNNPGEDKNIKGWRLATKLKLLKAINSSKAMLNKSSNEVKNRTEVQTAIEHMQRTLASLEN